MKTHNAQSVTSLVCAAIRLLPPFPSIITLQLLFSGPLEYIHVDKLRIQISNLDLCSRLIINDLNTNVGKNYVLDLSVTDELVSCE